MSDISAHFNKTEFTCKCGCNAIIIHKELINKLEKLHDALNAKAIYINSGYRCTKHDKTVGGTGKGMHTTGGAADIMIQKSDGGYYDAFTVAEIAEKIGFSGIGVINSASVHVDIRGVIPYDNNKWFGNEITGETYKTFSGRGKIGGIVPRETKSKINITIEIDGKKYSGELTEI